MPLAHGDYSEGTRQNVLGSDGTAILYRDELWGATLLTRTLCLREGRPYVLIDATRLSEVVAADEVASFVDQNGIDVLNIAGPRSSHWPAGHGFAAGMTMLLIRRLRTFYYTQFGRFSLTF
jgi:hypothetical protein